MFAVCLMRCFMRCKCSWWTTHAVIISITLHHCCSGSPFSYHFAFPSCQQQQLFLLKSTVSESLDIQQQQQQQRGPAAERTVAAGQHCAFPELCCVPLSTAGSAVGPCGGAGRTVRRCLSAASSRKAFFSLTSDRKPTGRPERPHHTSTTAASWRGAERSCGGGRRRGGGLTDCVMWSAEPAGTLTLTPPKTEVRSGFIRAVDYWTG